MRYYFVEQDDITVTNARGLREVAHKRELAVEDLVGGQIRLRSGSATAPNAPGGNPPGAIVVEPCGSVNNYRPGDGQD